MAAKAPNKTLKADFSDTATPKSRKNQKSAPDEEQWALDTPSRYARSYDALSTALMAIFEHNYLPLTVMEPDPQTGNDTLTAKGLSRYQQLKNRFMLFMRDDEVEGTLQLEITPSPLYRGLLNTGLCDDYIDGPAEIKAAIVHFFEDLTEIAADIPGVHVNMTQHSLNLNGPQAFNELISALCDELEIVTAERQQELYAEGSPQEQEQLQEATPDPALHLDSAAIMGAFIESYITSPDEEIAAHAAIPPLLFQTLTAKNYSYRELGHLVNRFNQQNSVAVISLDALQAVVDQDLAGGFTSARHPSFNLH